MIELITSMLKSRGVVATMMFGPGGSGGNFKTCEECGYKMAPPYPGKCPKCGFMLTSVGYKLDKESKDQQFDEEKDRRQRKREKFIPADPGVDFSYRIERKMETNRRERTREEREERQQAIEKRQTTDTINLIFLSERGDYLKMMGVIHLQTREVLYCSSSSSKYILELGANALEIASSILGGDLDKILFEPPSHLSKAISISGAKPFQYEEAYFIKREDLLFCIYGVFFKRPDMLLKELSRMFLDVTKKMDMANLSKMDRYEIKRRQPSFSKYIIKQYKEVTRDVITKSCIPTMEQEVKIHYVGLSYRSIGTMSLLITKQGEDALPIEDVPFKGSTADGDFYDLLESLVSAKIEAIAANTLANTGAFPRYIITKIGFDSFRLLAFMQLQGEYNLQVLATGNANLLDGAIEEYVIPVVKPVTAHPFSGMLDRFNKVKMELMDILQDNYTFTAGLDEEIDVD